MVQLLQGMSGSDVPQVYPDSVSDLEWGHQEALRHRMDLILFEGVSDLVAKVQVQFLEICSHLVSSIQHKRFKGHFEFGMETFVSEEWGDHSRRVRHVVVCE